jgi:hypothetical protein
MIDLKEARRIAYDWHGGQGSPLYSFASTGDVANITPDTLGEVDGNAMSAAPEYMAELIALYRFLDANMPEQSDDDFAIALKEIENDPYCHYCGMDRTSHDLNCLED